MTMRALLIQTIALTAAAVGVIVAVLRSSSTASYNSNPLRHQVTTPNNNDSHRSLFGPLIDPKTVTLRPPVIGNLEKDATQCQPVSEAQAKGLAEEIAQYERSKKFQNKIQEVTENNDSAIHQVIASFLQSKVLRPGWSILELGCAAGAMLNIIMRGYESTGTAHGPFVGVELTTGWVKFAAEHFAGKDVHVYEGDITSFALPEPFSAATFDFVMLNDVVEHIQKDRYGCFFQQLREVTHEGSIVYMHTPNPVTQIIDSNQYYENVLPHHFLIAGMAYAKFELVHFELDSQVACKTKENPKYPTTVDASKPAMVVGSDCTALGMPMFYHAVFRRVDQQPVFNLD